MSEYEARTISVEAAGQLLGLSRASAYQAAACGEIPTIRVGKRLLVPKARLAAMLGERDLDGERELVEA